MEQKTSLFGGIFTKIAVLMIFVINIDVGLVSVALGEITKAFPGVDPSVISLVMTLPVLLMIPTSYLSGKLCQIYSKKSVLIFALVVYIIGGLGGVFMTGSIMQVLLMRSILGIGAGFAAPISASIITELYDGQERATMLGFSNAFGTIVAIVMTMLAGWLTVMKWNYIFFAYSVFLLILILEIVALPSMPPEKTYKEDDGEKAERQKLGWPAIKLGLLVLSNLLIGVIMFLKLAIFVDESGIGNALTVATAQSVQGIVMFISALCFSLIYKVFKRYTFAIVLVCTSLAFFLLAIANSVFMVILALAVNGVGNALMIPSIQLRASNIGTKATATFMQSFVMGALFIGQFLAGFMPKVIGLFGIQSIRGLYTISGVYFAIYTIAFIIWTATHSDKEPAGNSLNA